MRFWSIKPFWVGKNTSWSYFATKMTMLSLYVPLKIWIRWGFTQEIPSPLHLLWLFPTQLFSVCATWPSKWCEASEILLEVVTYSLRLALTKKKRLLPLKSIRGFPDPLLWHLRQRVTPLPKSLPNSQSVTLWTNWAIRLQGQLRPCLSQRLTMWLWKFHAGTLTNSRDRKESWVCKWNLSEKWWELEGLFKKHFTRQHNL